MATSTVKYNGCTINGVSVSPGNNYSSYDLHFGRAGYNSVSIGSSSSPISLVSGTDTTLATFSNLAIGTYILIADIYFAGGTNNGKNSKRLWFHYEYTDGTENSNGGQVYIKAPQSGYTGVVHAAFPFWNFGKIVNISLVAFQDSGQNQNVYGAFSYRRI